MSGSDELPTSSPYDLAGRTALITGAAGLLGVEHAGALWDIGASVVMTDVDETALTAARNDRVAGIDPSQAHWHVMDVTSTESVMEVARQLQDRDIRIDILINNAALDPKVGGATGGTALVRLEDFSIDEWDSQVAVGLRGAFLCSQIFGGLMAEDGQGGVILNIASDLSVIAPDQRLYKDPRLPTDQQPVKPVTYSVIKTGLIGLTRYLATYWADSGVRANALSPGGVHADQDPDFVSMLTSLIPLGRMAHRNEYQAAIQFLCSDASKFMTGQNLVIDGGRSVW